MLEHTPSPEEQAQILQTIEMFEVITRTQPDDYQSLEILKEAYTKLSRTDDTLRTSRKLAERLIHESHDGDSRLNYLGELLLSRPWNPKEKTILQSALAKFRTTYRKKPADAARLLNVGESKVDKSIPARELAVWMLVSSAAMNLDAVVNK